MLVNQRHRNAVRSRKTYPGADCNSDHNLLMAEMVCKMTKLKKRNSKPKLDQTILKSDFETKERYAVEVKNRFEHLANEDKINTTAEED